MSENREEILANFQSITAIDDVAEAIFVLENCGWDLLAAVNRVMPADDAFNNRDADMDVIENVTAPPSPARHNVGLLQQMMHENEGLYALPGTSRPRENRRLLHFHVRYKSIPSEVDIPDSATVGQLKTQLAPRIGIPLCRQILTSWPGGVIPSNDTVLSTLNLPLKNVLTLTDMQDQQLTDNDNTLADNMTKMYTLAIRDLDSDMSYNLKFPGTKLVLEVKTDVYTLTDIPVRHQVWTGWPQNTLLDTKILALIGLDQPSHSLTVKKSPAANYCDASTSNNRRIQQIDLTGESDSSVEEFEDASESFNVEDDIFVDQVQPRRVEPLIPDNVDDETIGCLHFSEQFHNRYGPQHPTFFTGSLEDALKDACQKPARERKMLAIYLHHENSILSNVFCTQLLGFESVLQTLNQYFVVFGWDLTFESNKNMFLSSLSGCLGSHAALSIRSVPTERLPAVVIVMRTRSITEVFTVIHGNVGVNELITSLMEAVDAFTEGQRTEVREEDERAAREQVKWEQDEAYRESLEADRAKEESKRRIEMEATEARERLENEQQRIAAKKEAHRKKVEMSLPPEPENGAAGDGITKIRVRLPQGNFVERRFTVNTELKVLLDFLTVQGYPSEEFKVISSWPRRDLTTIDPAKTLRELKLFPQETVIVEER